MVWPLSVQLTHAATVASFNICSLTQEAKSRAELDDGAHAAAEITSQDGALTANRTLTIPHAVASAVEDRVAQNEVAQHVASDDLDSMSNPPARGTCSLERAAGKQRADGSKTMRTMSRVYVSEMKNIAKRLVLRM
jgi:hypothetical protein